jgi:hypothetical protein
MSEREIEVQCPCCETTLLVDVRTRTVLRHAPKAKLDETGQPILDPARWDQASSRVKDRTGQAGNAFDAALAREQSRPRDLDALFEQAKQKAKRKGEDTE